MIDHKNLGRLERHCSQRRSGNGVSEEYRLKKWALAELRIGVLTIALPARAFAAVAGGGMLPWDQPLNTLQTDLQGPVAHAVTTAAIIGTGITWAVSEHGTGVRKMSAIAFGGAAALGATT